MERLQKYMASCGVASRRECEKIIEEGRVKINGEVVTMMGIKVSEFDIVEVDGKRLEYASERVYYAMNKPRYFLTTVKDPKGRRTIMDLIPEELSSYRMFPVGRLDYDTKGIILLTNDGEFMNMLVGPSSKTEKEYLVRVKGIIKKEDLYKLSKPMKISGKKGTYTTRGCKTYLDSIDRINGSSLIGIIIEEGKYHEIKDMCKTAGFEVIRLTRIRFGCISVDGISEGNMRKLTPHEVKVLFGDAKSKKK